MSVLIKGMEMPRDCEECRFSEVIDGLGCMVTHYLILRRHGQDKPNWCPLVDVPTPHGRLIDADKFRKFVGGVPNCYNGFSDTYDKPFIIGLIDEIPTIIEAEKGEKE